MSVEWRIGDNVEIAIGRSHVECALPARIGYMGGGAGEDVVPYGRWFEVWFGILVWYINVEYSADGLQREGENDFYGFYESDSGDGEDPLTPVRDADGSGLGGGPTIRSEPYADPVPDPGGGGSRDVESD